MGDMASANAGAQDAGSKIFVGGLDRSVDEGVIRSFFQQFGPVVEVLVMRDPHSHQSRGFGFVTFQRDDSAKQVLQNRYHDMLGKRVEVKSSVPRGQAPPPQRGPPRSSQGYGYDTHGQPRGGPGGQGGPGGGYGYGGGGYNGGNPQAYYGYANPQAGNGNNPWGQGMNQGNPNGGMGGGQNQGGGPKANYGYNKDAGGVARQDQAGGSGAAAPAHGWTEHTAPEGYVYYYNSKSGVSQWERPMEL